MIGLPGFSIVNFGRRFRKKVKGAPHDLIPFRFVKI